MLGYLDCQPVKVNNSTVKTIATLKTIATVKTIMDYRKKKFILSTLRSILAVACTIKYYYLLPQHPHS